MMYYTLWWTSKDRQACMNCGQFETFDQAMDGIEEARNELLEACSSERARQLIDAGMWSAEETQV